MVHRGGYQTDADLLPVRHRLLGAFALATLPHAAMNNRSVTDSFWMVGLLVGVAALALHLPSEDVVFQFGVAGSLAMVLWLLQVVMVHRGECQTDTDSLPIAHMLLGALAVAAAAHADMNSRPVFDTLWMAGLFVGAASVLPQL